MAEYSNAYTHTQISTMQQDAIRRVNEMQRIAREKLGNNTSDLINQPQPNNNDTFANPQYEHNNIPNIEHCETEVVPNGFKGLLEKLNLSEEKIIIIMLLILLVNEGADIMLILALVYILL